MRTKIKLGALFALFAFFAISYSATASPPTVRHVQKQSVNMVVTGPTHVEITMPNMVGFYHTGEWNQTETSLTYVGDGSKSVAVMRAHIVIPKWRQSYIVPRSIGSIGKIKDAFSGKPGLGYFPKLC